MMTVTPERENFPTFQSVWDTGTGKDGSQRKLQVSNGWRNDDSPPHQSDDDDDDGKDSSDSKTTSSRYSLFSPGISARALWSVTAPEQALSKDATVVEAWECEECGHENYRGNQGECELCGTGICFMDERKNNLRTVERQLFVEEYGVDDDDDVDESFRRKQSSTTNKTKSLRELLSRHPSFQQKQPTKKTSSRDGDSCVTWSSAATTPTANLSPASAFSPVGSPLASSSDGGNSGDGETSPQVRVVDNAGVESSQEEGMVSPNKSFRDEAVEMEGSRRNLRSGTYCLTPPVLLCLLGIIIMIGIWIPLHKQPFMLNDGPNTTTDTTGTITNGLWVPQGDFVFGDEPDLQTGASVALASSGSVMAIGVGKFGPVRAYHVDTQVEGGWSQQGQDISLTDGPKHVALSRKNGRVLAVASESDGSVATFSYDKTIDEWNPLGEPLLFGVTNRDDARASVSLSDSGKVLAVGVPSEGSLRSDSVRIFGYDRNTSAWTPIGNDVILNAENEIQHGGSVSLSSNGMTLAVGSWSEGSSRPPSYSSHAEVYRFSNSTWQQVGGITNIGLLTSPIKTDTSVSLSEDGNIVAIGSGDRCRVFQYKSVDNHWIQLGQHVVGRTVSLSANGKVLAVGNPTRDENLGETIVYQYDDGSDSWMQIGESMSGEVEGDSFGAALSMSQDGKRVAIGAPRSGANAQDSGSVGVFQLE